MSERRVDYGMQLPGVPDLGIVYVHARREALINRHAQSPNFHRRQRSEKETMEGRSRPD